MIFLPWDLVQADGLQEFHDITAPVVMRGAVVVLGHEDDRHVREKLGELPARLHKPGGVAGHRLLYGNDGKGDTLLYDDGTVYGHVMAAPFCNML